MDDINIHCGRDGICHQRMHLGPSSCSWPQSQRADIGATTCHTLAKATSDGANSSETGMDFPERGSQTLWEKTISGRHTRIRLVYSSVDHVTEQRKHQHLGKELNRHTTVH